ncbi:MAG: glycosyltransferase [Patescibacteria group bacterium]|nr:glycosyltransferase [Patescibacteria group bacterium]
MKILLINYEFPPFGGGGGRISYEVAKILSKQIDVDILTAYDYNHKIHPEKIEGVELVTVPSFRMSLLQCGLRGMISFVCFAVPAMQKALRNNHYDLIHYFFSIPTGLVSLFQDKKTPYIVSLNGGDVPYYTTQESSFLQMAIQPINKTIVKRASAVTAVSGDLASFAKKQFGRDDISVIHNGINTGNFCRSPQRETRNNGIVRLICVSRLAQWKRIDLLIRALQGMTGVVLEIIGDGGYRQELKRLVRDLKLESIVTFRGYVKNGDLKNFLQVSDVFVLPSNADSFGIVFLEAMACGLPVIGCRAGGVPEVIADGQTGLLVQPNDLDSLRSAIKSLVDNMELRAKMGNAGLQRAKDFFEWDIISARYLSLYQTVLSKNDILKQ